MWLTSCGPTDIKGPKLIHAAKTLRAKEFIQYTQSHSILDYPSKASTIFHVSIMSDVEVATLLSRMYQFGPFDVIRLQSNDHAAQIWRTPAFKNLISLNSGQDIN